MVLDRGLTIPQDILDMARFVPEKRKSVSSATNTCSTGTKGMLSKDNVRAMVGVLTSGGRMEIGEAEMVLSISQGAALLHG